MSAILQGSSGVDFEAVMVSSLILWACRWPVSRSMPPRCKQSDQSVPFRILPYREMPHAVNPAQGLLANTNNDPVTMVAASFPSFQQRKPC